MRNTSRTRSRWVSVHRGPRVETEFLAELLEAIDVEGRVIALPSSRRARTSDTRLVVRKGDAPAALTWLERAFADAWQEVDSSFRYALGC